MTLDSDFRERLFETLKQTGTVDRIKSQLRSRLIQELQDRTGMVLGQAAGSQQHKSVFHRAISCLILDYFKAQGFEYSLSVFLPESGLSSDEQILSVHDLLEILRLTHRPEFEKLTGEQQPLLPHLLSILRDKYGEKYDKCSQTVEDHADQLNDKLKLIDEQYSQMSEHERFSHHAALEERMISYQKKCDSQVAAEVQKQMETFRANELRKVEEDLKIRYQYDLENARAEYEREDEKRRAKLKDLEAKIYEEVERKRRDYEAANYQERQQLLQEQDAFSLRQETFVKEMDLGRKSLSLQEERLNHSMTKAQEQLREVERMKTEYHARLKDELQRYQTDFNKEHAQSLIELKAERARLNEQAVIFETRNRDLETSNGQLNILEKELATTREALQAATLENAKLIKELERMPNPVHQQPHAIIPLPTEQQNDRILQLQTEISRLHEKILEADKRTNELQHLISDERQTMQNEQRRVQKYKKIALKWQNDGQHLVLRLESLLNQNEELHNRLDTEIINGKEYQREIADLRLSLHRAQNSAFKGNFSDFHIPKLSSNATKSSYSASPMPPIQSIMGDQFNSAIPLQVMHVQLPERTAQNEVTVSLAREEVKVDEVKPGTRFREEPVTSFAENPLEFQAPIQVQELPKDRMDVLEDSGRPIRSEAVGIPGYSTAELLNVKQELEAENFQEVTNVKVLIEQNTLLNQVAVNQNDEEVKLHLNPSHLETSQTESPCENLASDIQRPHSANFKALRIKSSVNQNVESTSDIFAAYGSPLQEFRIAPKNAADRIESIHAPMVNLDDVAADSQETSQAVESEQQKTVELPTEMSISTAANSQTQSEFPSQDNLTSISKIEQVLKSEDESSKPATTDVDSITSKDEHSTSDLQPQAKSMVVAIETQDETIATLERLETDPDLQKYLALAKERKASISTPLEEHVEEVPEEIIEFDRNTESPGSSHHSDEFKW